MRTRFASLTAGIGALALAVTGIVALGTQAEAYSGTPPWVGNTDDAAHVKGSLVLYNASGAQITSGSSIQALAAYVGTTGDAPRSGATKATANLFSPDPANTAVTIAGISSRTYVRAVDRRPRLPIILRSTRNPAAADTTNAST